MAKRLTKKQKDEIIISFTNGKTIEFLSQTFSCTKLTIIRNLKTSLGESTYKELLNNKVAKSDFLNEESQNTKDLKIELNLEVSGKDLSDLKKENERVAINIKLSKNNTFIEVIVFSPLFYFVEEKYPIKIHKKLINNLKNKYEISQINEAGEYFVVLFSEQIPIDDNIEISLEKTLTKLSQNLKKFNKFLKSFVGRRQRRGPAMGGGGSKDPRVGL